MERDFNDTRGHLLSCLLVPCVTVHHLLPNDARHESYNVAVVGVTVHVQIPNLPGGLTRCALDAHRSNVQMRIEFGM